MSAKGLWSTATVAALLIWATLTVFSIGSLVGMAVQEATHNKRAGPQELARHCPPQPTAPPPGIPSKYVGSAGSSP